MPTRVRSTGKTPAASVVPSKKSSHRAPFGFALLFLLLVAAFAFSTFYVISQTAREQAIRQEAGEYIDSLANRVDGLQSQVNTLSAQVSIQQATIERLEGATSTATLPSSRPAQR